MPESDQHRLDRVRRPRVHITYDVEDGGKPKKVHLPFVVGVMADLSGQPKTPLKGLTQREFVEIDRDNFNSVMQKQTPRVAVKVANKLSGDEESKLSVELNFRNMEDFSPANVAKQIPALKELLDMRQRLGELMSMTDGNDKLEQLLSQVLTNSQQAQDLAKQRGLTSEGTSTPEAK
jgi:type VI secretion system protein ImpB